ncbi:hypothetical protein PHLGIDRAFT_77062 [Phlebiopsis gigantea 11061_1 CR5-6]|uniref:HIT domain-containing protein n=1 Tax=Phlebiopsis gigantea (strain 11061_1 CR5-6) TaxID=745531 RepID=A0A0C3NG62_PHLG1|nr:hypothetical protein PHLGIDRAFT_77062 [Phlebiopsis gigantea 11061_1 CR5-6]
MTSFIIKAHEHRELPQSWKSHPGCVFCKIISGDSPAFKVYEDEKVVAILDIQPLRPGHTLVIPKTHEPRVSELPPEFAAAVGVAVSKVSNAIAQGLENTALNVVCNQEYAQAVPHVHYHIIPAPNFNGGVPSSPVYTGDRVTRALTQKEMHFKEFEARNELDDDDAAQLLSKIRARL